MAKIKAMLCDADGVIWIQKTPLPGAVEALRKVRAMGVRPVLVTNNAGRTRADYRAFLASIGLPEFTVDDIFTSGYATARYLKSEGLIDVFVSGYSGLRSELSLEGINVHTLSTDPQPVPVQAVVCSKGENFGYAEIARSILLVRKMGAKLVGTNPDPNFPVAGDVLVLGSGAVVAAIERGSGRTPIVIGKPEAAMFSTILSALGVTADEVMMVGDRWVTDIAFAARCGARSVLVLSGVDTEEDLRNAPPEIRPTYVRQSLAEVADLVAELNEGK